MTDQEKLYETLGELLFCVAKADGIIQDEEKESLKELLKNHPWGSEIQWSFNYEESKNASLEETYQKVINFCKHYGPAQEYTEFIDAMNVIAQSSNGIDANESKVINSFSKDLMERFHKDIEKLN